MASNRLALAALGLACVVAAAGGGYVATRQNAGEPQVAAAAVAASSDAAPTVQETEGVVSPQTRATAPEPAADTRPRPARATAAPPRAAARPSTPVEPRVEPPVQIPEHAQSAPNLPAAAAPLEPAPVAARDERVEAAAPPEPPRPEFEELTVSADSVIGLQTETTLSSERARIEDKVEARVVRDVRASGRVAIPAGSRVLGSVVMVERGGRARTRARLGIRFHTLALADGTRLPISTETIYRYGDNPANGSAAKIGGGAVAGAILGAIIGGGKGAAIGATTGAAGGGAAVMAGDRSEAVFPSGAQVTARIVSPLTITVDR